MKTIFCPNAGANTKRLGATTTSSNIALVALSPGSTIRAHNAGSALAYIAFGGSGVAATVPTAGGAAGSLPLSSGAIEIFVADGLTHAAAITSVGTADVYFTTGMGA